MYKEKMEKLLYHKGLHLFFDKLKVEKKYDATMYYFRDSNDNTIAMFTKYASDKVSFKYWKNFKGGSQNTYTFRFVDE